MFGKKKIPKSIYFIVLVYLGYCFLFTPNFEVTLLVMLFPVLALRLLWIDGQPNVLFWGIMLQWLCSSAQLIYCNFLRITLEERAKNGIFPVDKMVDATAYSIIGIYVFTLGLFLVVKNLKHHAIDCYLLLYSPIRVLYLYIAISIIVFFTSSFIWSFPAFVQYFYFFFYIKWGFFVFAFYIVHKLSPSLRIHLYSIIAVETLFSFSSFFAANFLNLFLFSTICFIFLKPKLNIRFYFFSFITFTFLLHLLILWTSVKGDYRFFVSNGKVTQSVQVSRSEASDKLFSLITNVDKDQYERGIELLVDRIGYIQYFAATLDYVPKSKPHQNGRIYLSVLQHYLVPRFLNPDKAVLDDSRHTQEFTGIYVSGTESATSFSLGYIADAYIDFGPFFMYFFLFLFGLLFGFFFNFLHRKAPNQVWSLILTAPFMLLININGTDTHKALGWILIYFLVVSFVSNLLFKRLDPVMRETAN